MTKLKASVDLTNVAETKISLYDRVENSVGKGENVGEQHFLLFPQCFPKLSVNQHFLLFPQCFPKLSSLRLLKVGLCGEELNGINI